MSYRSPFVTLLLAGLYSLAAAQVVPSSSSYAITFGDAGTLSEQTSTPGGRTYSKNYADHWIKDSSGSTQVLFRTITGNYSKADYGSLVTTSVATAHQGRLPFGHQLREYAYNNAARVSGKGAASWHDYWTVSGPWTVGAPPVLVKVRGTLTYIFDAHLVDSSANAFRQEIGFFFGNTGFFNVNWDAAKIQSFMAGAGSVTIPWEQTLGLVPGVPMHITSSIYASLEATAPQWDGMLHEAFFSNYLNASITSIDLVQPNGANSTLAMSLAAEGAQATYQLSSASGALVKSGTGYNYLAALAVPEPSNSSLLLLGLAGLGWAVRRREAVKLRA